MHNLVSHLSLWVTFVCVVIGHFTANQCLHHLLVKKIAKAALTKRCCNTSYAAIRHIQSGSVRSLSNTLQQQHSQTTTNATVHSSNTNRTNKTHEHTRTRKPYITQKHLHHTHHLCHHIMDGKLIVNCVLPSLFWSHCLCLIVVISCLWSSSFIWIIIIFSLI